MQALMDSLYAYGDWANERMIALCEGLSDEQLDRPREMGFGSLRATLYHILAAEVIWLERWEGLPWRSFPTDPQAASVAEISEQLQQAAQRRTALIEAERGDGWSRLVNFEDSRRTPYSYPLRDLLLHVFQHGVHHRAQALSYLKQFDRKVVGGLDYIFYRLAQGNALQSDEAVRTLRAHGMGINERLGDSVAWNSSAVLRSFAYSEWATKKVLDSAGTLDDELLDRPFDMGQGSIRKILLHMFDAERWWNGNWTTGPGPFPHSPTTMGIAELSDSWRQVAKQRVKYLTQVDDEAAHSLLELSFGGPSLRLQIVDTVLQVAMHGTHHRAQLVNLFRQVGSPIGNIDLLYALSDLG